MTRVVTTTTTGEPKYFDLFKVFLYTFNRFHPDELILADLVDCNESHAGVAKVLHPNIECRHVRSVGSGYCGVVYTRPTQFLQALTNYDVAVSIDNDVIVRGPIDKVWDGVEANCIKFWNKVTKPILTPRLKQKIAKCGGMEKYVRRVEKLTPAKCVQAGVFSMGSGEHTLQYYNTIMHRMKTDAVFSHQTLMWIVYKEMKRNIQWLPLNSTYNDIAFRPNSKLWHCRATDHFNHPKYQVEFQKWLGEANAVLKRIK